MEVLYWLVPAIIAVGGLMVGILFWAVRSGQYDDMEGPAQKILMDDDDPKLPKAAHGAKGADGAKAADGGKGSFGANDGPGRNGG